MTEKSDSPVLVPGKTLASSPKKSQTLGYQVPIILHASLNEMQSSMASIIFCGNWAPNKYEP
jgi:hypothetical protein